MLNVRGIANSLIQSVNPNRTIQWLRSDGSYTTNAAGHREPNFVTTDVRAQVQALSGSDLMRVDGLNMSAIKRAVYLWGDVESIVRTDGKGGDVLRFPQFPGGPDCDWKVVGVIETWPDWCKVAVVLQ